MIVQTGLTYDHQVANVILHWNGIQKLLSDAQLDASLRCSCLAPRSAKMLTRGTQKEKAVYRTYQGKIVCSMRMCFAGGSCT